MAGDLVVWRYQSKTCLGGQLIMRSRIDLEVGAVGEFGNKDRGR